MILKVGVKAVLVSALVAALGIVIAVPVASPVAHADDVSTVEGARAKERQGRHLNRMERDALRRYGGNDDWGRYGRRYGYGYGYDYDDYAGPGVTVYIGPRRYYGPYGY